MNDSFNINSETIEIVTREKIATGAVTPDKLYGSNISKNLFDKSTVTYNKYVHFYSGQLNDSVNYFTSDFIKVTPLANYAKSHTTIIVAFYTADLTFVSGITGTGATFEVPSNASYVRISHFIDALDTTQIELGNTPTFYEPYYYSLNNLRIYSTELSKESVTNEKIKDGSVSIDKVNFISAGKNLFNKETALQGYYINWNNGNVSTNPIFFASDFIKVSPSTSYARNDVNNTNSHLSYYTKNKVFISGVQTSSPTFTTPSNAAFIRFSQQVQFIDSAQIEKGTTSTAYEPFGKFKMKDLVIESESITEENTNININLLSKTYGVVGKEINIYFDNIILGDYKDYLFDVTCTMGRQQSERWTTTPTAAGTFPITIDVYDKNYTKVGSATSTLIVKAANVGSGVTKKALFIGASNTQAAYPTGELLNLFSADPMNLELIGTMGTGTNRFEGRGGWRATDYLSNDRQDPTPNPFWNAATSKFDFAAYMSANSYSNLNYVVFHLGTNDVFSFTDDFSLNNQIATMLTQYQTMIDNIKMYDANIKIGLCLTIPPNYSQDAFAVDYANGQTRWRYKRNNHLLVKALIERFKDKEGQGIYLVPINTNLDTLNNYANQTEPVNSRNNTTIIRSSAGSGVHPAISGYHQIADIFYYWLKSFEV